LIISAVFILGIAYFFSKWNKINVDDNIGKSTGIKTLDKKVFDHTYLIFDSTKVKTDFEIYKKLSDTVTFNFSANKNPNYSNLTLLTFNSGDGFAGVNINVVKYKSFFYASSESYTDNKRTFDFLEPERYIIKNQKLTLNKTQYKKGDSIYGKIELEIKFTPTNEIVNSEGYFRSIVD